MYENIRIRAHEIAAHYPQPAFYRDLAGSLALSARLLKNDPFLVAVYEYVASRLENDFGHGLDHVTKVTVDAGALMHAEARQSGQDPETTGRWIVLAQCAGLLHDIRRKEKDHAARGAETAEEVLRSFPLDRFEIEDVCQAIRNHEAFKLPTPVDTPRGQAISDCLYDADKFRWGPDNFTDTVWHMACFFQVPLEEFLRRYPEGVKSVARIKETFRSETGRKYGPQFIDIGMDMGREIYDLILAEFVSP
ncbi:MAG: HD domain-containing protein [Proteobacteria bacterium]|nr:HD domain-containing protein [Pseudomonadota bacterium]